MNDRCLHNIIVACSSQGSLPSSGTNEGRGERGQRDTAHSHRMKEEEVVVDILPKVILHIYIDNRERKDEVHRIPKE